MKLLLAPLLVLLAAWPAQAQEDDGERRRIRAERAAVQQRYEEQERACRRSFAVTDCIDQARRTRNETQALLRRQEVALNDAERRRRALERLREIEARSAPEVQQQEAQRRARALADQQAREASAAERARRRAEEQAERAARPRPAKQPRSGRVEPQGNPRGPRVSQTLEAQPSAAARRRAQQEQRVKEAQERKAAAQLRAAQRTRPAASGLPVPP